MIKWLAIALLCTACQVGDPLVDVFDEAEGIIKISCNLPPGCNMPITRAEVSQRSATPIELECTETCVRQTSSGDSEACPAGSLEQLPKSAHCMLLEARPASGATELRIDDVDWQDVNFPLRAERPLTLVIHGGTLQRVYFELEGPISVRIEALEQFDDLRIVGRANAQGSPSVALNALLGVGLSMVGTDMHFPGELTLTAGVYQELDLAVATLTAESATMQGVRLRAETSTLTDVALERALVETNHALWSAFAATDATLHFCGDARLITGQMSRCPVTTCEGSNLRMYNDSFVSGSLDGDFELSGGNVENVQLGPHAATQIFAYGSAFAGVNLCVNTALLVLGTGSNIKCSACVDEIFDAFPVCAVEATTKKWLQNYCEAWSHEDPLPLCAADTPIRANRAR